MAEMNEKDIVRGFEDIAEFDVGADAVRRDIENVRQLLEDRKHVLPPERESVWRIIMKSKWTKMSTAVAAVIVAVVIGFNLWDTPKLEAAELLMQVAKNMEELAWTKTISKNYVPGKEEAVSTDVHWTDVQNKRVYAIYSGKYIHLMDYNIREWSIYRPETNDMIIKPLKGVWRSPSDELETHIKMLEEEGVEVTQSEGAYKGKKATIIQFDKTNNYIDGKGPMTNMMMGGKYVRTMRFKVMISGDPLLMGAAEISYLDHEDNVIKTTTQESEAIKKGPADVYELGVPRDCKIIDKRRDRAVQEVREKIREHQKSFLNEYVAVITEARIEDGEEDVREAFVIFCEGRKLRVDSYRPLYEKTDEVTPLYEDELRASLGYVKDYWKGRRKPYIDSVRLYDGLWQYVLEAKDDKLKAREKQRRPDGDMFGDDDLDDFTWRTLWWLNEPEHMYEDDYSRANGLIAMELTSQSLFGRLPKRQVLYVDPEKDYVCHRYVNEELLDAPWQEDKNWLEDVEGKGRLTETVTDRQVVEYGRTAEGKWYPKVITEKGYRHYHGAIRSDRDRIIRIHLIAENPEFPEGIFDPERLPKVEE